eukprot:406366_1
MSPIPEPPGTKDLYHWITESLFLPGCESRPMTFSEYSYFQINRSRGHGFGIISSRRFDDDNNIIIASPRTLDDFTVYAHFNPKYKDILLPNCLWDYGYLTFEGMEIILSTYRELGYPENWGN